MYSSDRMKTLIRIVKDYNKHIVFRDCQMHFLNIKVRRKEILLNFFRHVVELPAKINRCWTTFETLEIERVAQNDNSTLHWRLVDDIRMTCRKAKYQGTVILAMLTYRGAP